MGVIEVIFNFLGGVAGAAFSRLFADEAKAWLPNITDRVVCRAVANLPFDRQERFAEEWRSDLSETPGNISKLWVALGFLKEARVIKSDSGLRQRRHSPQVFFNSTIAILLIIYLVPLFILIMIVLRINGREVFTSVRKVGHRGIEFDQLRFYTGNITNTTFLKFFMVKSKFDELPYLLNVIRGDMIIVISRSDKCSNQTMAIWKRKL